MKTAKQKSNPSQFYPLALLYAIVLIEGASVMAIELTGVKMIAPYYGTTLYVWAGVLTVTLMGLALGYFSGGRIALKFNGLISAPVILLTGAAFVVLMPFIAEWIMTSTDTLGIRLGSLVAASVFLMPPLICMGMISPVIIQVLTHTVAQSGKVAGTVYALSTVSGIAMTLMTGLYLLPEWGIRSTLLLVAGLLAGVSLLSLFFSRKLIHAGGAILILAMVYSFSGKGKKTFGEIVQVQSRSEGVLGQITVFDYLDADRHTMRYMLINGIPQTYVMPRQNPISSWPYIHRLATMASAQPRGSKALLIGMAGGPLAMELSRMGYETDIVEIDPRMPDLATRFFGFKPDSFSISIDDGRHFLNTTSETYSVIIIDVVNGEVQPYHMFTRQALASLKKRCTPDALVVINFQGYLEGPNSMPVKSLLKTLQYAGFNLMLSSHLGSVDSEGFSNGDIHIVGYLGKPHFEKTDFSRLNPCCQLLAYEFSELFLPVPINYQDGYILDDNLPNFEKLNLASTELWRSRKQKDFKEFSRLGFTLYN